MRLRQLTFRALTFLKKTRNRYCLRSLIAEAMLSQDTVAIPQLYHVRVSAQFSTPNWIVPSFKYKAKYAKFIIGETFRICRVFTHGGQSCHIVSRCWKMHGFGVSENFWFIFEVLYEIIWQWLDVDVER